MFARDLSPTFVKHCQWVSAALASAPGILSSVVQNPKSKVGVLERGLSLVPLIFLLAGCAASRPVAAGSRPFFFERGTFVFSNDLVLEYHFDKHGQSAQTDRKAKSDYRSEEHTSELQSHSFISYAVF